MTKKVEEMTYKEFKDYCNARACDGMWKVDEFFAYSAIMAEIDKIQVKVLGILKKKEN